MLLEYGFVHPRPLAMPKYRAEFVIAAYEGLKVDWVTIITECLKFAIESLVEGKKSWMGVAEWLTLLVPPVLAIKPKRRGRPDTTPKKATKRRQLLEKHIPGWTLEDSSQHEEAETSRRPEPVEKATERPSKKTNWTQEAVENGPAGQKPIKIKLEDFIQKNRQETTKEDVKYECIMAVFTLSLWTAQVWAISVNSIKGSCPKIVTI